MPKKQEDPWDVHIHLVPKEAIPIKKKIPPIHQESRQTKGWGIKVKNLLVKEIGCWFHLDALEVKSQRTAKLIRTLTNQDDSDTHGVISSEGEEDDDSDNDDV